jgi:hypothetical protein
VGYSQAFEFHSKYGAQNRKSITASNFFKKKNHKKTSFPLLINSTKKGKQN